MKKFIKYVLFSIISTAVNVGTFYVFYNFIWDNLLVSNIVAYACSFIVQFITNKKYVFENNSKKVVNQSVKFIIVKVISFTIDTAVLYLCSEVLGWGELISKLVSNASTTLSNYGLNKGWVFKK